MFNEQPISGLYFADSSVVVALLEFTKILRTPRHAGLLDPGVRLMVLGKQA